jgi:P4 family phage/plasmid primase-like protien
VKQPTRDMLAAALAWCDAGCSVVPVATDGSKSPLGTWKQYQTTPASRDQVTAWFTNGHPGLGVVCGAVSGHLEMLEIEGRAVTDGTASRFLDALDNAGLTALRAALDTTYREISPSGGAHFLYRVTGGIGGNTKLARRPAPPDPTTGRPRVDVLIETRGEGGFVVVAPSHGPVHPTGNPWLPWGDTPPGHLVTLTADERDSLHAVAASLDEIPTPPPIPDTFEHRDPGDGATPGEDFNQRGDWRAVLEPAGWVPVRALGDRTYWRRPGKTIGISAVTGGDRGDYLYVWSTSTSLPAEAAMSKWRTYAHLHHGEDFTAAASALRRRGYGAPRTEPTRPVPATLPTLNSGPSNSPNGTVNSIPVLTPPDPPIETTYQRSDDGNALVLVDRFNDTIRFCPQRSRWLAWNGVQWQWCAPDGSIVREYAKRIARALPDGTDTETKRWKQRSLSALGITSMLLQARTDQRIVVPLTDLDTRTLELNTPTGIIDLTTGLLRPCDPTALHTRVTATSPNPDADPRIWLRFLADTFTGHPDMPSYLQRLVGYSATGVVRQHLLPFAYGAGANGKGVFLETLRAVLGDYATTAPSGFLMAHNYAQHETEIARLSGARMVICSEINDTDKFDEAKVKQLTGGDTLTARFMRMDHFTFRPTHKLWLMGNHQPTVTSGGYSFWRRLRIVPFTNTVPPEKRIEDFHEILATEHGPAVLAWIVAGAAAYFTKGLIEPASVRVATAEYEHGQDTVGRFVEECCHLGGDHHVKIRMSVVRSAYERWCLTEGVTAVSAQAFGRTLKGRFAVGEVKVNSQKFYTGITLLVTEPNGADDRKDLT